MLKKYKNVPLCDYKTLYVHSYALLYFVTFIDAGKFSLCLISAWILWIPMQLINSSRNSTLVVTHQFYADLWVLFLLNPKLQA